MLQWAATREEAAYQAALGNRGNMPAPIL